MSILLFVLAFIACCAAGAGGAWGMRWYLGRSQRVTEREDPRDTKIRDLLARMKVARDGVLRVQKDAKDSAEHLDLAHERIVDLAARVATLSQQCEATGADLEQASGNQDLLRDKLSVASQQLDTLKQRNQELELELSVSNEGDILDAGNATEDRGDQDELETLFPSEVEDDAPSLLHSLSTELDRWKKHCHVLGDELKFQRERVNTIAENTVDNGVPHESIDELTDIRGIGQVLVRKLHKLGIYRYEALLSMSDHDMERAQLLIPDFVRRMKRDRWCEQARALHDDKYCVAV